jgi:hypothetical protein
VTFAAAFDEGNRLLFDIVKYVGARNVSRAKLSTAPAGCR